MSESKINWTELAKQAPQNPQSDKSYHPSHLEKVFTGKRNNALLKRWLHGMNIQNATTKKRTRNEKGGRTNCRRLQDDRGKESELSEITKAIRGKTNSNPTYRSKKEVD